MNNKDDIITYKNYDCDATPDGHCRRECWTSDGPLCDFDECPYEKEMARGDDDEAD